jgi:AcrR family transcriptional regulator
MAEKPILSLRERNRLAARDTVLDAAERLLRSGDDASFSMRALAEEAGVGFATPFNHFGSKAAIMQALSARIIGRMAERFQQEPPTGDAIDRVLAMGGIAVGLLLEQPEVYKVVVGSLGTVSPTPTAVMEQSRSLWAMALDDLEGISREAREMARSELPKQLAFGFRGCLSFWIAGEIPNEKLPDAVEANAATILLGFAAKTRRRHLIERITTSPDL